MKRSTLYILLLLIAIIVSCNNRPDTDYINHSGVLQLGLGPYSDIEEYENLSLRLTGAETEISFSHFDDVYNRIYFDQLPFGTYVIEASAEGFGMTKKFGIKSFGMDTIYDHVYLAELINITVEIKDVQLVDDEILIFFNRSDGEDFYYWHPYSSRVFVSTSQDVSSENYRAQFGSDNHSLEGTGRDFIMRIDVNEFSKLGYGSGDQVFFIGHHSDEYAYLDPDKGLYIYPSIDVSTRQPLASEFIFP